MKSRRGVALSVVAALVILNACSGGSGTSSPTDTMPTGPVDTGMDIVSDGFTFANFAASAITQSFDATDLVAMFGSGPDVCVGGVDPCVATAEANAFARMVNQVRASGHCEGLVVLAASRFVRKVSPASGKLLRDDEVVHSILRAFATQFLPKVQDETDSWAKKSLKDKVIAMATKIKDGEPGFTLGVYTDRGGHAILPYAIDFISEDVARIKVYDSNWPDKERFVTVDLKTNQWSFSFSGADPNNDPAIWTGGKGEMDITSLEARLSSDCPFCGKDSGVQRDMFVIRSVDSNWSITTDDGTVSPDTTIAGNTYVRIMRSPGTLPQPGQPIDYIVSAPISKKPISMNMNSEARIVAVTPKGIVEVATKKGGSKKPIIFTSSGVASLDSSVHLTLSNSDFVVTSLGDNNSLYVTDNGVAVTVDGADGNPVTVETTSDQQALEVLGASADGLPSNANYVVSAQSGPNEVTTRVVNTDGTEQKTTEQKMLPNQLIDPTLPEALKSPTSVPGAPQTGFTVTDESTTTTTVAPSNTTSNTPKTQTGKPGNTTSTVPVSRTTQPASTEVSFNTDITQWGPTLDKPGGQGFSSMLTLAHGTSQNKQSCSNIVCLETLQVAQQPTSTTSQTSATFTMSNVAVAFSIRCGDNGQWVIATASGATYSATCSISNVTKDDTIYLKAT